MPIISFNSPFYANNQTIFKGSIERIFSVNVLEKLIEPLYEDVENFSLWIYASFSNRQNNTIEPPTYDNPVYSNVRRNLTEDIF